MTTDPKFANWQCGICAADDIASKNFECRTFTMADTRPNDSLKEDDIACVFARMGPWDLNENDEKGRNLGTWVSLLRAGAFRTELGGKKASRQEVLKAVASLNVKAVAFHKAHFAEMIVTARACDFRKDPKKDRTARVAVCENPILSLRNVGQEYPVLALDMDTMEVLTRDEFRNILTGLAAFYDLTDAEIDGPAAKRQKVMFGEEMAIARAMLEMQRATLAVEDALEK